MAEITRRRTGEFLRKLFELLMPYPGMQAREALAALEAAVPLTEYEKGIYESGGRRFEKFVRFATVDCRGCSRISEPNYSTTRTRC